MMLEAAKARKIWCETKRREVGRDSLLYHTLLAITVCGTALAIGGKAALWLVAAYLPALLRAFQGWAKLTPELPPLKRVGMRETLFALWFMFCLLIAIRLFGQP